MLDTVEMRHRRGHATLQAAEPRTERAPRSARCRRRILARLFSVRRLTCSGGGPQRAGGGQVSAQGPAKPGAARASASGGGSGQPRQPATHRDLVSQPRVVDARLRLCVCQRRAAADHRLGELGAHHLRVRCGCGMGVGGGGVGGQPDAIGRAGMALRREGNMGLPRKGREGQRAHGARAPACEKGAGMGVLWRGLSKRIM